MGSDSRTTKSASFPAPEHGNQVVDRPDRLGSELCGREGRVVGVYRAGVCMRVDEPWDHRAARGVEDDRVLPDQRFHVASGADRSEVPARYGECLGSRGRLPHRDHIRVRDDQVGTPFGGPQSTLTLGAGLMATAASRIISG